MMPSACGVLRDEIRGDVPRGQTLDEVGVDENDLARLLDPLDVRGECSKSYRYRKKYGRAVARDSLSSPSSLLSAAITGQS